MRLGILRSNGVWEIESFVDDVAAAADAGFSSYWIPNLDVQVDSLMALAIAGPRVPGIELGAGIVPVWTQHPLALGQAALTAASVLDGRLSLGVGIVSKPAVEHTWGIPFERPITFMREYLEILHPVLANKPVHYTGQLLTARAPAILPVAPEPPLYLAALGTQMLRLAGSHSDGAILFLTGPKTVANHTTPLLSAAAKAAGRPAPRLMAGIPVLCTDDVEAGRKLAGKKYAAWASWPHYRAMFDLEGVNGAEDIALIGNEAAIRDGLRAYFAAGADDVLCYEFGETQTDLRRTRACLTELVKEAA
ncbi:TIGR03564 family F420-dependent LLM class oxidoreductase [Amycolatopsis sp. NPDC049252]|uniref:TIGR03564 family F420-dependent LLM class oxidoreductase n=1 Tax=Amycolatopsis sp. NPDC049252 TaxID=3363933 RepID=UPI003722BA05